MEKYLFTSEAVSEGHPDKICDQISDRIFDACLEQDPQTRSAVECFISHNFLLIGGELTTKAKVDYRQIAYNVLQDIGYSDETSGFNINDFVCEIRLKTQSPNISNAVTRSEFLETGAGDQGMMFGYASDENSGYMPLAHVIALKLVRIASERRKNGAFKNALPDMKSQVTIDYTNAKKPRIDTILMSVQHRHFASKKDEEEFFVYIKNLMLEVSADFKMNLDFKTLINSSGLFEIGGPLGDTGLTGRKIICDTYGGYAHHGGGAFSGKDATKVDRSGAYMARYIAKNLVAANICKRCEIQVAYAIGVSEPVSINVNTFGTSELTDSEILALVRSVFNLRPGAIIQDFALQQPSFAYGDIANYGHFGRSDLDLPWEKLDKVESLKTAVTNFRF